MNFDFVKRVIESRNYEIARDVMAQETRRLGADYFAVAQLPRPHSSVNRGIFPRYITNAPQDMLEVYQGSPNSFCKAIELLQEGRDWYFWWTKAGLPTESPNSILMRQFGVKEGVSLVDSGFIYDTALAFFTTSLAPNVFREKMQVHLGRIREEVRVVAPLTHGIEDLMRPPIVPGLTPRIRTIMRLKVDGLTDEEIADQLCVQPDTVKKALRRFRQRLQVNNTVELTHLLTRLNVI